MKTILFFDTETTGLPVDYKATYANVNNWPRLCGLLMRAVKSKKS